eukprot:6970678-Heterocapsa_arctica.AAC.1
MDRMNFGEEEGAGTGPANNRGSEGKGGGGGTAPPGHHKDRIHFGTQRGRVAGGAGAHDLDPEF